MTEGSRFSFMGAGTFSKCFKRDDYEQTENNKLVGRHLLDVRPGAGPGCPVELRHVCLAV